MEDEKKEEEEEEEKLEKLDAKDARWDEMMKCVPEVTKTIRIETERVILEEARIAMEVDGWARMREAVVEHRCVGFVWFRSAMASVWSNNQAKRFEAMVDRVLPGANFCAIQETGDFCLLLPPPPVDEDRIMLMMAVQEWGAWVWDPVGKRRIPMPAIVKG